MGDAVGFLLMVAIAVAAYFLPTMVALSRNHHNMSALAALNLLLGWTLIGWVAALVWALSNHPEPAAAAPAEHAQLDAILKQCPMCAETILAAAIKCKHCGSDLRAAA